MWGRADMGALPSFGSGDGIEETRTKREMRLRSPFEVNMLPNGDGIAEIWCGSEYTIASCKDGLLWATGWNEHGNLGTGETSNIISSWKPVVCTQKKEPRVNMIDSCGSVSVQYESETCAVASIISPAAADDAITKQTKLLTVWDGSIACGGGHCVAFLTEI